jgi:acetoacetyl-CoA synthetase
MSDETAYRLGLHRVLQAREGQSEDLQGTQQSTQQNTQTALFPLPQSAWRLDNNGARVGAGERRLRVERLELDSTSAADIWRVAGGDEERAKAEVTRIVAARGKMHNPRTDSGGVLVGRFEGHQQQQASDVRIIPLCSMSALPLHLDEVLGFSGPKRSQVAVRGFCILPPAVQIAELPRDLPIEMALAAVDVSRLLPQLRSLVPQLLHEIELRRNAQDSLQPSDGKLRVVVVGCGASGLCAISLLRHLVPSDQLRLVVLDLHSASLRAAEMLLEGEGNAEHSVHMFNALDVRNAVEIRDNALDGAGAHLVLNCVNVPGSEASTTVLCARGGYIVYFSMATNFAKAVLSTDGTGNPCTVLMGAGVFSDAAQQSFSLLSTDPKLWRAFMLNSGAVSWVPTGRAEQCSMAMFAQRFSPVGPPPFNEPATLPSWYHDLHSWSIREPARFWSAVWDFYFVKGEKGERGRETRSFVKHSSARLRDTKFFPRASVNLAENMLQFRGSRAALVFRSEQDVVPRRQITFDELYGRVNRARRTLLRFGVEPGSRVGAMLPNIPEAVVYMLATQALGAVWTAITPDSGAGIARDRLGQVSPQVVLVCDCYFYNGKRIVPTYDARELAPHVLTLPYGGEASPDPDDMHGNFEFVRRRFDDPMYILYTSGTTGKPKAIVQGFGVHLNHLKETGLHCDIGEGSVAFVYTNTAWMLWHWLVSTLALGATCVLYDGSPNPQGDWSSLWRICEQESCTYFGCGARLLDSCRISKIQVPVLPALNLITSTGSPLSQAAAEWTLSAIPGVRLSSIAGGTELNGCLAIGNPLLPLYKHEIQSAPLGVDADVIRVDSPAGHPVRVRDEVGELACFNAIPSMPLFFWGDDSGERYKRAYFDHAHGEGVWVHGDVAERTTVGGFFIYGRSDATLNPGGVRIGTSEYYAVLASHFSSDVLDSVVVEAPDVGVVLFVVCRELTPSLVERLRSVLRKELSPKHVPREIVRVEKVPYNHNSKKMEVLVKSIVAGKRLPEWAHLLDNLQDKSSVDDYVRWANRAVAPAAKL